MLQYFLKIIGKAGQTKTEKKRKKENKSRISKEIVCFYFTWTIE